jgi:hypothetical protein
MSKKNQDNLKRQLDMMEQLNVIERYDATAWSQVVMAPKPADPIPCDKSWRVCID